MEFLPFSEAREYLDGQYERIASAASSERGEELYLEMRRIFDSEKHKTLGKGRAIRYFLNNADVFVNPYDIFADMIDVSVTPVRLRDDEHRRLLNRSEDTKRLIKEGAMKAMADFGHTMPDWERVLKVGIGGIISEAEALIAKNSEANGEPARIAFYESVREAYLGISEYVRRLEAALEASPSKSREFTLANLKAIELGAPKTLAEAMQLYFVFYRAQQFAEGAVLRSLGAIDSLLYPFYKHDVESGMNEDYIAELVRYFLYKWNSMRTLANIPFDIGSEFNAFTEIIVRVYEQLDVHDPKIHVKCSEKSDKKLLRYILDLIRKGNNSFVFINEDVVISALKNIGIDAEDANNYTLIGCYEPSAVGKELPCTLNGRVSLPMAVELALRGVGDSIPESFKELFDSAMAYVDFFFEVAIKEVIEIERKYPDIVQAPILSATYSDCMERGIDIYSGGAKYNNSSICAFGIGTFVDELLAIKHAVYEDGEITLPELREVLRQNWRGAEALRLKIRKKYPKYGTGDPEADALTSDIIKALSDKVNDRENGRGGVFRLGLFSIDWIFNFGKKLGASADGRYKGEPISKNLSASVGMDKNGVTGTVRSVMAQDHTLIPNGAVLDVALHPTTVKGDGGIDVMYGVLSTYLNGGGFAIQMNVLSPDTLRAAQREPEKYRNLQVRLCGWNVYFTDLDEAAQNNLIDSMENA